MTAHDIAAGALLLTAGALAAGPSLVALLDWIQARGHHRRRALVRGRRRGPQLPALPRSRSRRCRP